MQKYLGEVYHSFIYVALGDPLCTFLYFSDSQWVTNFSHLKKYPTEFVFLFQRRKICVIYVSGMPEQEAGWEGREVKGEVESENGNQTSQDFGSHCGLQSVVEGFSIGKCSVFQESSGYNGNINEILEWRCHWWWYQLFIAVLMLCNKEPKNFSDIQHSLLLPSLGSAGGQRGNPACLACLAEAHSRVWEWIPIGWSRLAQACFHLSSWVFL